MTDDSRRHTIVESIELVSDPDKIAEREAANAVEQFDAVLDLIDEAVRGGRRFRLRPSRVTDLHRIAMIGIHPLAGTYRNSPVEIGGSAHQPPREHQVANLVEEMCDWLEDHWSEPALTLCAYAMWRLNWIHPFADGNGRTSRAVAYLILCVRSGFALPGKKTIPEQIAENRPPYYAALEKIDRSAETNRPDLSPMEHLLAECLKQQLESAFAAVTSGVDISTERKFT